MNNLSSYCGLVDAKIGSSDKDLPVHCTTVDFVRRLGRDCKVEEILLFAGFSREKNGVMNW